MDFSALIESLVKNGASPEMILAVVKSQEEARAQKREANRQHQIQSRERKKLSLNNNSRVSLTGTPVSVTQPDTSLDEPNTPAAPLNAPSSLFPDPLPTTPLKPPSTPDASAPPSPPVDFKKVIFDEGLRYMATTTGKQTAQLRSVLGKWIKDWGEATVAGAIIDAQKNSVVESISYIEKVLKNGAKRNGKPEIKHHGFSDQDYTRGAEGFK